jgi:hypothetical protein
MYGALRTDAPFSTTIRTTREQKYADRNAIHRMIVTH